MIKQIDVPTVAGVVGVLAKHVPTLGVLKPGVVQITDLDGGCLIFPLLANNVPKKKMLDFAL